MREPAIASISSISFFVPGTPRAGGSKRAFVNRKTGGANIAPASDNTADWRTTVLYAAREAYSGPPLDGPLRLDVVFFRVRPRGHFGTGRNATRLKPSAPAYPISKPDPTKLLRSTEDALTDAGIWVDDARVVFQIAQKRWAPDGRPGAWIRIQPMEGEPDEQDEEQPNPSRGD